MSLITLYRVLLQDDESNYADTIVSAYTDTQAGRIAVAEVATLQGRGWQGKWRVADSKDAIVPIELVPPRVHAIVPGWD